MELGAKLGIVTKTYGGVKFAIYSQPNKRSEAELIYRFHVNDWTILKKKNGKWFLSHDKKLQPDLGPFETPEEAIAAELFVVGNSHA